MRRRTLLGATAFFALGVGRAAAVPRITRNDDGLYLYPGYDPRRDPAADRASAAERARSENKRVLLEIGGDWCVWCTILDNFLVRHDDVRAAFRSAFVVVKVNVGPSNANEAFMSAYPPVRGYPAFIILDENEQYLASQRTGPLERGRSYNRDRMLAFAQQWRRT
ncbi:MAG: thioredoxin family protein [Hyphomonadaceae bacterium]